ncbi:Sec62/63 complex, subunit Sec66 [Spinellus fusiger]|nr:Sec62/63 complex, subunit Sec66 [Spinellus fusiger]
MYSLIIPIVYLSSCVLVLSIVLYVYRSIKGLQLIDPWFSKNIQKENYIMLLSSKFPIPDHHLRTALLLRATEAVKRLFHIQKEKPAAWELIQINSMSNGLWQEMVAEEQALIVEMKEISHEADLYRNGWGKTIFSTAAQMLEFEDLRKIQRDESV